MKLTFKKELPDMFVYHCGDCDTYYAERTKGQHFCQWCKDKPPLNEVTEQTINPGYQPNYYCGKCAALQHYFAPPINTCPICAAGVMFNISGVSIVCPTETA